MDKQMQVLLNGKIYQTTAQTIAMLVDELGIQAKTIAIAQNTHVVKKEQWHNAPIKHNDEIEILQFVGGG